MGPLSPRDRDLLLALFALLASAAFLLARLVLAPPYRPVFALFALLASAAFLLVSLFAPFSRRHGTPGKRPEVITAFGVLYARNGFAVEDIVVGRGVRPVKGQIVRVHYAVRLEDDRQLASSRDHGRPLEFRLGEGDQGLMCMKVGGRRKFTLPPELVPRGGCFPPDATLIFDVELLGIVSGGFIETLKLQAARTAGHQNTLN